jgi:CCR4-NOT transcription complex subunit 2
MSISPHQVTPAPPPPPPVAIRPQQIARLQSPQSDLASRLSLLSFVTSFEDGKTFNETDLASLGLDLNYEKPIVPILHSVLSDSPLAGRSWHPIPECYAKVPAPGLPQDKISLFSEQTLMFIFDTEPRSALQNMAANELIKRGFVYDDESERWRTTEGREWSVELWKEVDAQRADE